MNYLEQVQRGIDYIEANLDFSIKPDLVAKQAGISQWHFQRIFKAMTNETLKTYIRSRRMANSLDKLLSTNIKIIDIALTAGFESQESFTRAFKNTFNMTPNEYRKIGSKNLFLKKLQFDSSYLKHINQNISLTPIIYSQKKLLLAGLKTEFYGVDSEKNNLAEKLPPLWDDFLNRIDEIKNKVPGTGYGIIQQTHANTDLLEYFAAVEVFKSETLPENMVHIEIPASTYAKFTHKGAVQNINNTVNYIYSSWLIQSGKQHIYGPDLEIYGPHYQPDSEESIVYYAIPIK